MVWIKICGTTSPDDAIAAADAGADAVGMLFAPSKRRITIQQGREIARVLPQHVEKVGVFYDESPSTIEQAIGEVGLTAVQLHGDESPDFVAVLVRKNGRRSQIRVFKTIHITGEGQTDFSSYLDEGLLDGVLLDTVVTDPVTGAVSRGGTGKTFDWSRNLALLQNLAARTRVIVAGGLCSANVAEAVRTLHPWGVDVCSGVEREPGRKDPRKLREFVAAARAANM